MGATVRAGSGTGRYGLAHPTVADLYASIADVFQDRTQVAWQHLLAAADGTPAGGGPAESVDGGAAWAARLIEAACASNDPIVALCGRAQRIRLVTFKHLKSQVPAAAVA